MNEEINRIRWKCRRGMREIDLLLREFSITKLETLNENELSIFSDILNYDDQKLYDFIFKKDKIVKLSCIYLRIYRNKTRCQREYYS